MLSILGTYIHLSNFLFLASLHSMWDLNFLTRGWTHILCIGSSTLNHWTIRDRRVQRAPPAGPRTSGSETLVTGSGSQGDTTAWFCDARNPVTGLSWCYRKEPLPPGWKVLGRLMRVTGSDPGQAPSILQDPPPTTHTPPPHRQAPPVGRV